MDVLSGVNIEFQLNKKWFYPNWICLWLFVFINVYLIEIKLIAELLFIHLFTCRNFILWLITFFTIRAKILWYLKRYLHKDKIVQRKIISDNVCFNKPIKFLSSTQTITYFTGHLKLHSITLEELFRKSSTHNVAQHDVNSEYFFYKNNLLQKFTCFHYYGMT